MESATKEKPKPVPGMPGLGADRSLWFMNHRITFNLLQRESACGIGVMRAHATKGDAPPLHVHHTEDEIFHVVQGRVKFRIGDREMVAGAGQTVVGPRGIPHGFRILSDTAETLIITHGGFERLVQEYGRPPEAAGVPDHTTPTPEMQAALVAACARLGIDILGPPIA